ncbi:MAG: VanZ family protein [Candidatus Magnetoovum sp. WYHC-5]|nr:VanZ family protein [Candidatus Magnetoovum sp. WYHC-5]
MNIYAYAIKAFSPLQRKVAFYVAVAVIFFFSVIPDTDFLPEVFSIWDKLNHLVAFFVLAFLIDVAYKNMEGLYKILVLLGYGFFIECVQALLPTRFFSFADMFFNLIGLSLYFFFLMKYIIVKS